MSCKEPDFLRGCSTRLGTRLCTAPLLAVAQSVPREGGMGAASTNWAPPRGRSGHGPLEPHDGKHKQAWAGFLRGGCHTSTKHSGPGGTKGREQWHSAGGPRQPLLRSLRVPSHPRCAATLVPRTLCQRGPRETWPQPAAQSSSGPRVRALGSSGQKLGSPAGLGQSCGPLMGVTPVLRLWTAAALCDVAVAQSQAGSQSLQRKC